MRSHGLKFLSTTLPNPSSLSLSQQKMTSATTLHFKLLECCCVTAVPRAHFSPSISRPLCPPLSIRQTPFSPSLKSKNSPFRIVPFVAQTSDWAQQEEEAEEENGAGYGSDGGIEANATDSFVSEGEEEIPVTDEGIEANDGGNLEEGDSEDSYPEPPEEAKVFVGNLPYDVDSENLAQLFDQAGVVEISEVIYNRQTDQSRGFGFVTMSTVEEAEKAVELFNRYDLNGRLLTVNKAAPRGSKPERVPRTYEPSFKMYVGNLPWQVDDARLEEVFSELGKVVDARVVYDRESGRSRGFGFVTMSSESEANDAIAALDGQNLDGRAIKVNIAEERPRRGF